MFNPILPLVFLPLISSAFSNAHPVQAIHPGHGGPRAPVFPPPLSRSSEAAAHPIPTIPAHDDSQQPLYGKPIEVIPPKPSGPASPPPSAPSSTNLAVYYGHPSSPSQTPLPDLCADPAITTIIISSVRSFSSSNGFPVVDFGSGCPDTRGPDDRSAPGLATCPALGAQVKACQSQRKQILLSIGGPDSLIEFADVAEGRRAAIMLWDLFGQGDPHGADMRPFGEGVAVDGFDFALTTADSPSIRAFATTLRALADMRKNRKPSYLSTTPACHHETAALLHDAVDVVFAVPPKDGRPGAACDVGPMGEARLCSETSDSTLGCQTPYRLVVDSQKGKEEVWALGNA